MKLDWSTSCWCLKSSRSLSCTSTHPTMFMRRSRSWSWMIDSHSICSTSNGPSVPEIRQFQTLTLKYPRLRSGWGQRSRSLNSTNALPFRFTPIGPAIQISIVLLLQPSTGHMSYHLCCFRTLNQDPCSTDFSPSGQDVLSVVWKMCNSDGIWIVKYPFWNGPLVIIGSGNELLSVSAKPLSESIHNYC